MKALGLVFLFAVTIVVQAQVVLTPVNSNAVLVSSDTNRLNVSKAALLLSGLRLGMEMTNFESYLNVHGITNHWCTTVSLDRGEHYTSTYDFSGTDMKLVLESRSRRMGPDLFDWGFPVLTGGRIQRLGVDAFLITFTNAP